MKRSVLIVLGLLAAGCASPTWNVISDINEIARIRTEVSKPGFDLSEVKILRLQLDGRRVEVTSIGPVVIGFHKDGAPAAKTTFTFTTARDKLVLFTQDVPKRKAFHVEMPVGDLVAGKQFNFPVVQEDGTLLDKTFTVEALIVR